MGSMKKIQFNVLPNHKSAPWIVYSHGMNKKALTLFCLSTPTEKYIRSIPHGQSCEASTCGGLIMVDGNSQEKRCTLWNPTTEEKIELPPLRQFYNERKGSTFCSSSPSNPNLMTFLIYQPTTILYCEQGDTNWRKHDLGVALQDKECFGEAICFFDGTLYALTNKQRCIVISKDHVGCLSTGFLEAKYTGLLPRSYTHRTFMVESCGELFLIILGYRGHKSTIISEVEVPKFDFQELVWERVENLGGRVFLLGLSGSFSCSSKGLGVKGDCLYFAIDEDKSLYMFDMEDESVRLVLPCPHLQIPCQSIYWVIPRNRLASMEKEDGERFMEEEEVEEECNVKVIVSDSLWSNLPADLCNFISSMLLSVDYTNFRGVCRKWRSINPETRPKITLYTYRAQSPLLMSLYGKKGLCTFFDPVYNISHDVDFPELSSATILCSSDGWLLMSLDNTGMFLFNPFTRKKIELPDLPGRNVPFDWIGFTSQPTFSDCLVIGSSNDTNFYVEIFIWSQGDTKWTTSVHHNNTLYSPSGNNPVYCSGKFYVLGSEGNVGVLRVDEDQCKWKIIQSLCPSSSVQKRFLLECNGELLLVIFGTVGEKVHVYKLNNSKRGWVDVKTLNHHMLFLSHAASLSMATTEKRIGNKIYLPRFLCDSGKRKCRGQNLIYSLRKRRYYSFGSSVCIRDWCETKEPVHCTWIQPPLCFTHF